MKKMVNVSDMVILFCLALGMMQCTDVITVCIIMTVPLILAAAYHTLVFVCGPLAESIPTINSSWLTTKNFSAKLFWKRRIFEATWSFACVYVVYWQADWFKVHLYYVFCAALIIVSGKAFINYNLYTRAK